ncbi:MAG: CAAD domain-containing protein [Cyanobium sp.]
MSDSFTELQTKSEFTPGSSNGSSTGGFDLPGFSELIGKANAALDSVDWNLMSKAAKATGILLAVIVAQILIKGVLDTINILPVVPGLLELLGLVVVGRWSWANLRTSDKRTAVVTRIQTLRQEYLG